MSQFPQLACGQIDAPDIAFTLTILLVGLFRPFTRGWPATLRLAAELLRIGLPNCVARCRDCKRTGRHRHYASLQDQAVTAGQGAFVDSPVAARVETPSVLDLTAEQRQ